MGFLLSWDWDARWIWLGGSLLLAALSTNLAWLFQGARSEKIVSLAAHLKEWRFSPLLFQLLRFVYYIGVPFAALLWGRDVIIERQFGLQPLALPVILSNGDNGGATATWTDWMKDLGWVAVVGCAVWLILAIGWGRYRATLRAASVSHSTVVSLPPAALFREAMYHELHWAFYRHAPVLALGIYRGSWIGLGIVALEALLNPGWYRWLQDPAYLPAQLVRSALGVASTICFITTQNVWLTIILHWVLTWELSWLVRTLPVTLPSELSQSVS